MLGALLHYINNTVLQPLQIQVEEGNLGRFYCGIGSKLLFVRLGEPFSKDTVFYTTTLDFSVDSNSPSVPRLRDISFECIFFLTNEVCHIHNFPSACVSIEDTCAVNFCFRKS